MLSQQELSDRFEIQDLVFLLRAPDRQLSALTRYVRRCLLH